MKTTKRIATILLAAAMLLICAGCASKPVDNGDAGLYVGTAMQDDAGSSAIMQGVYDKLVNGREYTQTKGEYAGLARFEEALKGDTIEITAIAENEWYEAMSGTWDYVLDGDYITLTTEADDYVGPMLFSSVTSAVAEYLGMDPELVSIYISAVLAQGLDSKYFIVEQNGGTTTEKIYVGGTYDMQSAVDSAYIDRNALDYYEPLNEEYRSLYASAGKVKMSAEGTRDSVDVCMAEYGGNTELTYKSLLEAVQVLQPAGYEEFLANYTALEEAETEQYQVKFLTASDEIPFAFEDFSSNYRYVSVHFGD